MSVKAIFAQCPECPNCLKIGKTDLFVICPVCGKKVLKNDAGKRIPSDQIKVNTCVKNRKVNTFKGVAICPEKCLQRTAGCWPTSTSVPTSASVGIS